MMKNIIVGTAGHIDHGKTALVKALTGVDADRLKEEKQRGITIDIGFADLTIGELQFGFVDVPGHERFVKNMLAGAHGLDLVMLIVAADESIMPQTREHFDICRLLQVQSGLVALTKADLVDEELLELARAEVEDFVQGSFLADAPIIAVSSRTGAGLDELKTALVKLAADLQPKNLTATPRLPVDRSFSIKGFGTVVTGTLIAGELKNGDEIEVLPEGARTRVRNLQTHGRNTEVAHAGQRTAVNLQGISKEQAERGSVLTLVGRLQTTSMLDVRLDLLAGAPRPLTHRARVRLHHQTREVMARVSLMADSELRRADSQEQPGIHRPTPQPYKNHEGQATIRHSLSAIEGIAPGASDYVQLRLEEPIAALPGDRFIIRSYSPQITIGGGVILDALPHKHRLREATARDWLARLEKADSLRERVAIFIEMAGEQAMNANTIAARSGATDSQIDEIAAALKSEKRVVEISKAPLLLIATQAYHHLLSQVQALLAAHHKREPLSLGVGREEVRERLFGALQAEIFRSVITRLADEKKLIAERDMLRLTSHTPAVSGADADTKQALEAAFKAAGLQAGTLEEIAAGLKLPVTLARKFYNLLLAERRITRIGDFVFHQQVIEELKQRVRSQKTVNPKMDVAVFKDLTGGLSRKHAIPLLEFLDRERITRRVGNEREIL
ncbi:MAG: selenocysteine-specific translation elongation factor [Acidobacteria bacterium]|nr:selenocysteine-specific translation elongation factor [Acidobacteriota bacterium]